MFEHFEDLAFAKLRIGIDCRNPTIAPVGIGSVMVELPKGMAVDQCVLLTFEAAIETNEVFSITLEAFAKTGWTASKETGEALESIGFEHSNGARASIGIRDADWLCRRFNLELFEEAPHTGDSQGWKLTCRASEKTQLTLHLAFAEAAGQTGTSQDSTWFAVDLALPK